MVRYIFSIYKISHCQVIIRHMAYFVEIKIVSTIDELSSALALRKQIFVDEQGLDYNAEFDGNDLSSTHFIACINKKTVGTMRIRYFKDFVKFERACVIPEYRKTNVSKLMGDAATKFCAAKGYEIMHSMCKGELLNRWAKDGARPIKDAVPSIQHGMVLIPIEQELPKTEEKISVKTSPEILNKKEGEWFEKQKIGGIYEVTTKTDKIKELVQKVQSIKKQKQDASQNESVSPDKMPSTKDNFQTR